MSAKTRYYLEQIGLQKEEQLFILDRGVGKFPNEFILWETLLSFAKKQKLFKKIYKIYTNLLQLHPTSINSWINAANFEFEYVGSAKNARILFQKALRFNKDSKKLWLSYTIFELSYINKLLNRRKILGLITEKQQLEHENSEAVAQQSKTDIEGEEHDDLIQLPSVTNEELKTELNSLPDADLNMLGNPETNPALRGDVALTIFDICIETLNKLRLSTIKTEFEFKFEIALEFLKIFDKFEDLNRSYLNTHVVNYLLQQFGNEIDVLVLDISLPLRNLNINSEEFIDSLQISTKKYIAYKSKFSEQNDKSELKQKFSSYLIENFLQDENVEQVDEKVKQILHLIIKKL